MKVLFVSSGNSTIFPIAPFIKSQGESLKRHGIELEYFSIIGKGSRGYINNISRLKKHIRQFKPDIIHTHYSLSGWVSLLAKPRGEKVLSLMGSDAHGGNTKLITKLTLKLQLFLIQFFYEVIIVKSENLSNVLWARKKCVLIPNGVNMELFSPMDKEKVKKELKLDRKRKYILFVANPNDSNKNYKLIQQARNHIQTKDVEILTPFPVPHNKLALYYNACDVLVFPSFKEGSPNVIKEALVCNTKIVATDSGDIIERTKGIKSVWIGEFDEKDFAQKLDLALNSTKPVNSREQVRNEIDEDKIADSIIDIYNKLLNGKR